MRIAAVMMLRAGFHQTVVGVVGVAAIACGGASRREVPPPSTTMSGSAGATAPSHGPEVQPAATRVETVRPEAQPQPNVMPLADSPPPPCPPDMVHIKHSFCPEVERVCLKKEYNKPNHITLCHKFRQGSTKCLTDRVDLDFCVDQYEYPNQVGAHPPWMVSWYDAEATCRSKGKRTCWDWEWVAACEGPDETPFPYGWSRDNTKCNIDNTWIDPSLTRAYSGDRDVALRELSRLDQSVPSGAMTECVSGYGVHDLTGNLDEWTTRAKRDKKKSAWAGLKGGAWGHVRNACRPMTTSHPPDFKYYFITFRCCKDPQGARPFVPPGSTLPPVVKPEDRAPIPKPINPPGPSAVKVPPQSSK